MAAFVAKLTGPPVARVADAAAAAAYLAPPLLAGGPARVLGVFGAGGDDVEDDEREEFEEGAARMHARHDVYFGAVSGGALAAALKADRTVDRTPAVTVARPGGRPAAVNLDTLCVPSSPLPPPP